MTYVGTLQKALDKLAEEGRMWAFGHFPYHDGVAMQYIPEGAKRPCGRPYTKWWQDVILKDVHQLGFPKASAAEAFMWAQRRDDWRRIGRHALN